MENLKLAFSKYLFIIVFFAVFLVLLVMTFIMLSDKKKKRSIYFYGLFMNLSLPEKICLDAIFINFIYLAFMLIMKIDISIYNIIISEAMIALAFLSIKKYKSLFVNILINGVNGGLLYLGSLVNTLREDNVSIAFYILVILVNIFGLIFYMFTSLKFIRDIRKDGVLNETKNAESN